MGNRIEEISDVVERIGGCVALATSDDYANLALVLAARAAKLKSEENQVGEDFDDMIDDLHKAQTEREEPSRKPMKIKIRATVKIF